MKLRNFLALMAVACMATGFTSCDDDDDANAGNNPGNVTNNDFYGVAKIMTPETPMSKASTDYDSTFVTHLIKQADGKYSLVLPESSEKAETKAMPGMATITLKNLELTETTSGVLAYESAKLEVEATPGKMAIVSDLKISYKKNANSINVSYGLQYGKMPIVIKYDFNTLLKNDFIVGTFMGVNSTIMNGEAKPDSMNVATIELQKDGKYTLVLPEKEKSPKSFRGMELPSNIKVPNVTIEGQGNAFSFNIDNVEVKTPGMAIILNNVKGNIKGNEFNLTYELKPGKMPIFINFSYEANKIK